MSESESKGLPGLRVIRKAAGVLLKDLSNRLNLSEVHVRALERGRADCSLSTQRDICRALQCEPNDLVFEPDANRLRELVANFHMQKARELSDEATG